MNRVTVPTAMYTLETPPSEGPRPGQPDRLPPPPSIEENESLAILCSDLSTYFVDVIQAPHTFEQLRTASVGHILKPIISSLSDSCHHLEVVSALLSAALVSESIEGTLNVCRILKWRFGNMENDDRGIWETRGHACEIVAWRFLTYLSEKEAIDYLLHELPGSNSVPGGSLDSGDVGESGYARSLAKDIHADEHSPLLRNQIEISKRPGLRQFEHNHQLHAPDLAEEDLTVSFVGLNALEIAAIANAKKFLSQRVVQKIMDDMWSGNIVFWDTLSVSTKKHAQVYNKRYVTRYTRAVASTISISVSWTS